MTPHYPKDERLTVETFNCTGMPCRYVSIKYYCISEHGYNGRNTTSSLKNEILQHNDIACIKERNNFLTYNSYP